MFHGGWFDSSKGAAKNKVIVHDGWRVGLSLALMMLAASLPYLWAVLAAAVVFACLLGWSGISWKYTALRTLLIVPFGLAAILLLLWRLPESGWDKGLLLAGKLLAANWGFTFVLGTTSIHTLLEVLRAFRLPVPIVEMIGFTVRYLFVLMEEIQAMITAQRSRGMRTGSWASFRTYRRMGQLLGVLLVRSLERSVRIHQAMLARGYAPDAGRHERGGIHEQKLSRQRNRSEQLIVPVSRFDGSS